MKMFFQSLTEFIRRSKRTLLLIIVVALITILLHTLISIQLSHNSNLYIPSIGTIHTLNVDVHGENIQSINGVKIIDWGVVYPGSLVKRTFNVTSISNIEGVLIIKVFNWTFYDSTNKSILGPVNKTDYMEILIDPECNMTVLERKETIELTLTLNVTRSEDFINFIVENDIRSFSFCINIHIIKEHSS